MVGVGGEAWLAEVEMVIFLPAELATRMPCGRVQSLDAAGTEQGRSSAAGSVAPLLRQPSS